MLTQIRGHDSESVKVASADGDVEVRVPSELKGLPKAALTRKEAHEVLVEAKEKAENFVAAIEGDIEATA